LLYKDCESCVAQPFCKKLTGEAPVNKKQAWCNAKFRLDKAIELSEIPTEYYNANFFNFKKDKYNKTAIEALKDVIADTVGVIDGFKNILLIGEQCGVGKTYLASCILNQYIYKICNTERFDFESPIALFVEYPTLIHSLRQFDKYEDEATLERFEMIKNVPLLLLDDIGAGISSRFTREQTFILINHRYSQRLPTIVTSNLSIEDLQSEDVLGRRIISRLLASSILVPMGGKDRRVLG